MSEREINFSEDERQEIGNQALQAAGLGEDFIYKLVYAKIEIMKWTFCWRDSPELQILFPERDQIFHEVDVLAEIIRQARIIMQFEGKDSISLLDKNAQAAGLGSIFDPDSKIGQDLKDSLGR
jgi:hypothetical protein